MFRRLSAALLIVAGLCGHGSLAQTGDPAAPGAARESVAATKYLQVVDHYLFVALWGCGVQVLDISDPTRPKWVGGWNPRRCQEGIHVIGGRAYIADRLAGLTVLDVSNPTQPAQIGNVDTPGDAFAVDVAGQRAYVADSQGGLQIVDVTNPARPALLGHCPVPLRTSASRPPRATDVQVVGHHAWVASTSGLLAVDVRDPYHPVIVATHRVRFGAAHSRVQRFGTNMLLVGHPSMLQVLDISDPTRPRLIDRTIPDTNNLPVVIIRSRGDIYVPFYSWALTNNSYANFLREQFPTNAPRNMEELIANFRASGHHYETYVRHWYGVPSLCAFHTLGNLAVGVGKTFVTVDLSELTAPRRLGQYDLGQYNLELGIGLMDVRVAGRHAYVLDYNANIHVMDLSDPKRPMAVGYFDSRGYASAALALSDAGRSEATTRAETLPDVPAVTNMPELLAPERQPEGGFAFTLRAEGGAVCVIQVSTDFIHWTPLGTYTLPESGELRLADPQAAAAPQRFYRAVWQR